MQGIHLRKYGVEAKIPFILYEVDGVDLRVDAADGGTDCALTKDEGAETTCTNDFVDEGSGYSITLTATEMEAARISVYIIDSATKVWLDEVLIVETYGNASAQHAVDLDDSVRAGLTALPNAAANAAGGLTISAAGALAMDALADWVDGGRLDLILDIIAADTTTDIPAKLLKYVQLLARSDAAIETDNATELTAINADGGSGAGNFSAQTDAGEAIRDHVGNGTNLTEAGGDGDHLTAIDLPNQTMDITGNITGNLSGTVGTVNALAANVITAASINADAITEAKIADNAIAAEHLAAGAIDNATFAADVGSTAHATNIISQAARKGLDDFAPPTKAEMDTAHGLLATEAKQDITSTNVDQIETAVITNAAGTDIAADIIAIKAVDDTIAGYLDTEIADIQSRLPAALVSGRMSSDAVAISGSTDAADKLEESAETIETGTAQTGTLSTTEMTTDLTVAVNDQFNGRQLIFKKDTTTAALRKQATEIEDTVTTNGKLTFVAITTAPVNGDTFTIV